MNTVIMGPPGSGKSTQAKLLAKNLGLPHIETGEIYRQIAEQDTPQAKKVKKVMESGGLLDDQTTFEIVDKHLAEYSKGFVIDGFPRTISQAKRELVKIDRVFYLILSDQEASRRLLARARESETPDVISERLRVYHLTTEPILDYYRNQNKLVEIDGNAPIEKVQIEILKHLQDNNK